MQYVFTPEHVCSKKFMIDVDDETRVIRDFTFTGGCPGNLEGISRLIRGMKMDEVIARFDGMPVCRTSKVSSCPEQLAKALREMKAMMDRGETQARPAIGLESFSFHKNW